MNVSERPNKETESHIQILCHTSKHGQRWANSHYGAI